MIPHRGYGNDVYVLEYLHTVRDVRRDWLPRVRKIAANGRSIMVATLDQMPGPVKFLLFAIRYPFLSVAFLIRVFQQFLEIALPD